MTSGTALSRWHVGAKDFRPRVELKSRTMDVASTIRPRLISTLTLRWVVVVCGVVFVVASMTMISTILVGRIYPSLVGVWSISGDVALLAAVGVVIVELKRDADGPDTDQA